MVRFLCIKIWVTNTESSHISEMSDVEQSTYQQDLMPTVKSVIMWANL